MPEQKHLVFEVSLEEANLIFKALGQMTFVEVYELIGKLNEQANQQLKEGGTDTPLGFKDTL